MTEQELISAASALVAEGRRKLLADDIQPTDANLIGWLACAAVIFRADVSKGYAYAGLPPIAKPRDPAEDIARPTAIAGEAP